MPEYVVNRLAEFLNEQRKPINGSKIAILGVAYKKDVDDPRESPSFELMQIAARAWRRPDRTTIPTCRSLPQMRHYPDLPPMSSQDTDGRRIWPRRTAC